MLVLTRRKNQELVFEVTCGGQTVYFAVLVTDTDRGRVRLGIEADPQIVRVVRGELLETGT